MTSQFAILGKRVRVVFAGAALFFLFFSASRGYSQFLDQGAITGVVKDQTGSVIPGAAVTLTRPDTGQVLHGITDGAGVYEFSPLRLGQYQITVSSPGFQTAKQENISLQLGQRLSVPITLHPGAVSQTVTVTGAPPLLQTQESDVSQEVDTEQINDLPLNGRNAIFAAQFTAGAAPASTARGKGSGDFDANGLRPEQNDFVLDGMENMALSADGLGGSSFMVNPPPDALAEFKVSTSDYGAEFGHSAGAVVDESIKSGTNHIHGDLWEYWRNSVLDAKDFDALTIPEFRENEFGGTLGLPIIKNKLFFFGDTQEIRIAAGQPYTQNVPTLLERQGNFSELLSPSLTGQSKPILLYAPNSGTTLQSCNGAQNVFCPNQIDAVAKAVLNLYPLPNANHGDTYNNNVQNLSQPENTFQYDVRTDWTISQKDQAFARFSDFNQMQNYAGPVGPILDGSCGEGADCVSGLQLDFGNNFVISETHIFSPTLVNQFRFGFVYSHFDTYQLNYNKDIAASLGLGGMPFGGTFKDNGGLPTLEIGSIAQAGTHQYRPEEEKANVFQILDNVTKTLGKHTLNLGIDLENGRSYTLEPPASHGVYDFTGFFTSNYGAAFTGNGVADFLADQMHDGSVGPSSPFNDSQWHSSGYAQDDWRVSNNLTLNLGVRYDWFQPYKEMANQQASFYPTGTPGISTGAGVYEFPAADRGNLPLSPAFLANLTADNISLQYSPRRGLTNEQVINISPRLGFAYTMEPTTVLHGGFGFFYQGEQMAGAADNLGSNYPFVYSDSFVTPSCASPNPCASDGFNLEHGYQSAFNQGLASFVSNPSLVGISPNLKTTLVMDYNFTIQHSITNNLVASMGFVGDAGRHIPYGYNPNETTVLVRPGINLQPLLPFPAFGGLTFLDYEGVSSYNSLQAKLEKRFSNGLQFLGTYVWGHALDDAPDPLDGGIGNRDPNIIPERDDYTNSVWDVRQRATLMLYYVAPFGTGTAHPIHSRVLDETLGGWAGDLAFQVETGQPFSVGVSDIATANGGSSFAILKRNPFSGGGSPDPTNPTITCPTTVRTLAHWYNPCAFANPLSGDLISPGANNGSFTTPQPGFSYPAYVTGITNAEAFLGGRSEQIYGPGFNRVDVSLFKNFRTLKQQELQFRVDGFNMANTPEWANPSTANDSQTGGLISTARITQVYTPDARCFQLSAKYIF